MTPILGALVLVAVMAVLFFTPDGRAWFNECCRDFDAALERWRPLGKGHDPAIKAFVFGSRLTQVADPAKARRTLRRSMRVYLATRKGEL